MCGRADDTLWDRQRRRESIPKSAFSVNAAVVHCNKKAASASVGADGGGLALSKFGHLLVI